MKANLKEYPLTLCIRYEIEKAKVWNSWYRMPNRLAGSVKNFVSSDTLVYGMLQGHSIFWHNSRYLLVIDAIYVDCVTDNEVSRKAKMTRRLFDIDIVKTKYRSSSTGLSWRWDCGMKEAFCKSRLWIQPQRQQRQQVVEVIWLGWELSDLARVF